MKMPGTDFSPQLKHPKTKKNVSAYSVVEYELKNVISKETDTRLLNCVKNQNPVVKAFNEKHPFKMEKKGLI